MRQVLVIQFRKDQAGPHEQECINRRLPGDSTADYLSVFDDSIDFTDVVSLLDGYDKLILGGSGEIDFSDEDSSEMKIIKKQLEPLLNYVFKIDFPTYGACFGHHLIGYFLGTVVEADPSQEEINFEATINLTEEGIMDPIFKNLPPSFESVVGHKDSLMSLPKDSVLLAKNDRTKVQAFRYKNNIYGIQFHGELGVEDLIFRLQLYPEYKSLAGSIEPKPAPHAPKVLQNFLSLP
ncbi:MAG: hypothetical protein R3313_02195 [Candidatus Saccharimonadales bacterium]|nr:hypothetical protein [Candidatus Saccharimonadales bacterium]